MSECAVIFAGPLALVLTSIVGGGMIYGAIDILLSVSRTSCRSVSAAVSKACLTGGFAISLAVIGGEIILAVGKMAVDLSSKI
ncbi:MAG: hypothetical protein CMO30_09575 [Tistrella sp.]|uniref:hypothetical protein n=1 Tax=Tistrella sp. TaxID=2024861 RepID=UPI000C5509E9|nr:hypothetical protein [Tistrella sp.]MAD35230.1 hypothetical protein [Tistrella sp.]MBA75344.1 hypothetical protein [Tistrella sp.]MBA75516.1 hypothetical protein [Tistrella sp.]|tara:strand:+ start:316 stop:564 length:249 start_codon:yes stop_codon:yes gene_type:complete